MKWLQTIGRRQFEFPCSVEIENTPESLHAHVDIESDFVVEPGDEIQVIDAPQLPAFGDKIFVRRRAVVTHAGVIERIWTRLIGNVELTELYDVSFTERRFL